MSGLLGDPTSVEVAAVSTSIEWMMQLTSDLAVFEPQSFRSYDGARSEARASGGMVIVLGPTDTQVAIDEGVPFSGTGFVVLGIAEKLDTETLRGAMAIGFADLVAAGDTESLIVAVDRLRARVASGGTMTAAASEAIDPVNGHLVVVTSARAGQGTTSVAANVARILARTRSTILAEGDPRFGDLIDAFGVRDGRTIVTPSTIPTTHWIGDYIHRDPSGLHLLVLPQDAGTVLNLDTMIEVIALVEKLCEALVIDAPLWVLERFPLHRVADDVLLVTTNSDKDLRRVKPSVDALGLSPESGRIVVRTVEDGFGSNRPKEVAGVPVIATLPRDEDAARRADDEARPVVEVAPKSDLAGSFESLTERLVREWRLV
jgi:MinD-like ATPase involved in chromosome partitioning or flagellar assembly